MRAADVLAKRLYDAGCRYAFGMPGGEVLTILDALQAAGIEFILAKHENAAGFMAEGVWHRTGAPGILLGTIGRESPTPSTSWRTPSRTASR
jgi:acetolactate synthase-1/2/3 large subunit